MHHLEESFDAQSLFQRISDSLRTQCARLTGVITAESKGPPRKFDVVRSKGAPDCMA